MPTFPTTDALFDAATDETRRITLVYLAQRDVTSIEDVSLYIAERTGDATDSRQEPIATQLHHCHLPHLDRAGLVDYDPATHTVEATELVKQRASDLLEHPLLLN